MTRLDRRCAAELLDALEDAELPLLSWGVTSGFLAHDEVIDIIDQHQASACAGHGDCEPEEILDSLLRAALLFRLPNSSPPRYRTRLAETVRLTTRLRQLFGPLDLAQPPPNWWERGRTLVADYRLHVAPRRYPRRDLPLMACLGELDEVPGWGRLEADVAAAQADGRDLARFQLDAATSIYRSLRERYSRGVIVSAGTGSGKTLAFYLPAFAAMAPSLQPRRFQVHTLALYPRKELLRDQLREAVSAARMVASSLEKAGMRRIRIGALYGDTPINGNDRRLAGGPGQAWRPRGQDLVCPYLSCPDCGKELIWARADRARGTDRLRCTSCRLTIEDLALTRESLQAQPPDLLFTTTEMLSRTASAPGLGSLLGWRSGSPPRLVLLDEVHTYAGVHGAQVALLLRRWRTSLRGPVTFVGLSATLRDAAAFFAQLTGLDQTAVNYIEPHPEDLEAEGREYAIALRGDPVAGASLLSTSIQTAMLYGRILDTPGHENLQGSVGFLFTDDLDVTNRFYDNLRDAEGGQSRSGRRGRRRVLAGLRSPDAPFAADRYADGQSWDLVQRIGWPLDPQASAGELRIGRTSSQDAGVDRDADLIVATASLEVGYNDPRVGLVLQHKAPHDAAAFIQRRGRAGRIRGTRPWTVVTLSDYGRDRLAYQAYDTLFAPEIPPRNLPVGNRFVLKIQGTHALLDWLATQLAASGHRADPRELLRAPRDRQRPGQSSQAAIALLDATLRDQSLQDSLAEHLRRSLAIDADEVQALLWEQPRALLLSVVPTTLRRLRSDWRPVTRDPGAGPGELLPEFLTTALFDPLNVPEVSLELPFADDPEALPIERALREAVPGRISRRYGHRRDDHRTWLPLPLPGSGGAADVGSFAAYTQEGTWQPAGKAAVQVVRPYAIRLADPPNEIADQAQGMPEWGSQILAPSAGLYQADIPDPSEWNGRIISAGFATHAAGNPAEVRRMTTGADCETVYRNGRTVQSNVRYTVDGVPAAMGFRLPVDGMCLELVPLDLARHSVAAHLNSPAWRTFAFTAAIADDPTLNGAANVFQRGWLTLVYLTAFALAGLDGNRPAPQIHADLAHGSWRSELPSVLQVLYRDPATGTSAPERLVTALTALSHQPAVTECLDRHGSLLWTGDIADRTAELAQKTYRDTVAAAVLAAALRACPDAQDRDLIADVVPSPAASSEPATIWLTETSGGGLGLVEQLVRFYSQDPRRFWGLVDSALGPSDHEYVNATVTRLLEHVVAVPTSQAAQAMARLRQAGSAREADLALQDLRAAWAVLDGHPRQPAVAALSARLLRPGTTQSTDIAALAVLRAWDQLQDRLGFEVNARVIAYAAGAGRLAIPAAGGHTSADQIFSMLWPRGSQARAQYLLHYQPYTSSPSLDRLLAMAAHDEHLQTIDVTQPTWQDAYVREVTRHGIVSLVAPAGQARALGDALRAVPTIGVNRDVLRVYGEVRQLTRIGNQLRAVIETREALQ